MSNFTFLQPDWPEFIEEAQAVERLVFFDPKMACGRARHLVEQVVLWMYKNDEDLTIPADTSFYTITNEVAFKKITGFKVWEKMDLIRRKGNQALHQKGRVSAEEALKICEECFHVMYWLYSTYAPEDVTVQNFTFSRALVPAIPEQSPVGPAELERLSKENEEAAARLRALEQALGEKDEALAQRNREIKQMRLQSRRFADTHDYNESQTRELLIDVMLRESGWDPAAPNVREYEISGMPSKSGKGYIDYVLWDDTGKPLALVEAKRSNRDFLEGQEQARHYANALEKKFAQRPVIFLSNGYETYIWDDAAYPLRPVLGFYNKASLQKLFFQKREKQELRVVSVKHEITGRYYQIHAIREVTGHFQQGHRKALLVMATGTGKTRTAISVCDVLFRYKWAKRVLFLADRNPLVRQAYKSFAEHLPEIPIVNLVEDKNDAAARIVFSTYPTMLNQIEKLEHGFRRFDPGYFDLIIIDEAHRSIYNKYEAIFRYFDALQLGLTATPKDELEHDTYKTFGCENGNPTFAYELEQAVADNYLVPPQKISVTGKFLTEGIRYEDLSEEEKQQYDDLLGDDETGTMPKHIEPEKLNRWLFNRDTVEQVLGQLMEHGLKVEGGDRLGKTIIFARNQKHAQYICEIFDENYPHYAGHFCRMIHNKVEYAQELIDAFCSTESKAPVIAVSVDMMDTGIDAPEVVNLVFFKPVKSRVKFHQMIGRGTRLCKNLFSPGEHKTHFLIFDYCGNFEFFNQNPEGADTTVPPSLKAQIFEKRLLLAAKLSNAPWKQDEALQHYREELLNMLHQQVSGLERQSIQVRPHLRLIDRLQDRGVWEHLQSGERKEICAALGEILPVDLSEHETVRYFDHLMLVLQHQLLDGVLSSRQTKETVVRFAEHLWAKRHIPAIKKVSETLRKAKDEAFWDEASLSNLEQVRIDMRHLIQHIDQHKRSIVYTDFQDTFDSPAVVNYDTSGTTVDYERYRRKLKKFIEEHQTHLVIQKIRNAQPLTDKELLTLETFLMESDPDTDLSVLHEAIGEGINLVQFIRTCSGLEKTAVLRHFEDYLTDNRLTANQISFIEQMISFYTEKGSLEVGTLYEPPFDFLDQDGIEGVFRGNEAVIDDLLERVKKLNQTG
ncbi:type I restriction enzyme, R subunit [Cyclonatronum proteinivorum]|uniref:Type I restriction enzyme, R subunit n=1 Tax=Cyclonatronum proteinivorum TaxID=1457365 RepID=A0A345UK98_9BACT|nr:DEAD/DEAH box helicase family protein [Cyclonatronum proteinivorum]AXJ00900.1 type I restriction enzyme, R subunit [Cyclonatronum proteinivorum]